MIVRLKYKQRAPKVGRYAQVLHIDTSGSPGFPSFRGASPKSVLYRTTSGYMFPMGDPLWNLRRMADN
jgi:hypothetical protein